MTPLRRRMDEDMRLHGLSEKTRNCYISSIATIARFFGRSPITFTEEDLRQFFSRLNELKRSRSTITVYLCAVKFLYTYTLNLEMPVLKVIRPAKSSKLPVVFSRTEVHGILGCIKHPVHRMTCVMLYSCGLRINEALRLTIADIDSARMMLCIRNAKGNKDRYVPLPEQALLMLREYYRQQRPVRPWIFANPTTGNPYTYTTVEAAFNKARQAASVNKEASCHGLRRAYATHLFEDGIPLAVIQRLLGHRSAKTTAVYARITPVVEQKAVEAAQALISDWQF